MSRGTDAEWASFLASSWPGLVRTATLLAGDPAPAEGLAAAALLRTRREATGKDGNGPEDIWSRSARRILLRLSAAPGARVRARLRARTGADRARGDPLIERYRALGPGQRALLVLTVADHLHIATAAELLGLPAQRAARDLFAALDDLRGAGADDGADDGVLELDLADLRAGAETGVAADDLLAGDPVVGELGEAFARLAAASPAAGNGPARVERASVTTRRARRRTAVLAACLSVAAVTTTAGVAARNARVEAERQRVAREQAAYAAVHPTVLDPDVRTWPTRGSRASDAGLLADVRARLGRPEVVFAGDVAGVDVVVALTGPAEGPLLHVLAGAPGAPVAAWPEAGAELLVGTGAVPVVAAALPDEQGRVHLLAVTLTSGIGVSYSPQPLLSDDGAASRRYLRLPLTDGVGTALVAASPDRLRMRVDGPGFESIVAPLTLGTGTAGSDRVAATRAPVTTARSCMRAPELGDVPNLVTEATRDAGLATGDVTGIRLLWCREEVSQAKLALALTARRGPDIQCYEAAGRNEDGTRTTSSQCWPVPRGTGTTAPFLAPDVAVASPQSEVLDLTVNAHGAASADLRAGPPGSPPLASAQVAADGYVRFVVPSTAGAATAVFESEGVVVLRDSHGEASAVLPVRSRHLVDVWGDGTDGPVTEP